MSLTKNFEEKKRNSFHKTQHFVFSHDFDISLLIIFGRHSYIIRNFSITN